MQHYRSLENLHLQGIWLTIGSFDGIHIGHQSILKELRSGANKDHTHAVVLTFHPHPSVVLRKREGEVYLTSPEERAEIMTKFGVDVMITHPFDLEFAKTTARDFVAKIYTHLQPSMICVGYDFALGRGREGNVSMLKTLGDEYNFQIKIIEPVYLDGEVVSSSRVRSALADGDLPLVQRLLGRHYQVRGKVIPGDGRGKLIGIPTANLEIQPERTIPKTGVYACRVIIKGENHQAVTNVGYRPTFESTPVTPVIETHLLDFDQDLYGKELRMDFVYRLRDEQRFENINALVNQIHRDIQQAKQVL